MKGKGLIWIWALLLVAACTPVSRESARGELGITVEFPSSAIVSKADEGSVSASLYEDTQGLDRICLSCNNGGVKYRTV